MAEQPTGTVTLLFSDIEGSTALLQRLGTARYADALDLHRRLLRAAFERHGGYEVDCEGDAFFVAFGRATDAVAAATDAQRALLEAAWPEEGAIRVRMGLHTGEPMAAPPKYVGLDVHKAARVMSAGHGGQVLVTGATQRLLGDDVPLLELGEHRLKDLSAPEPLYQLQIDAVPCVFPALKTLGGRPNNLPLVATPFIGRSSELMAVQELVRRKGTRIVTLTGPGGIGKTRLALQAAAEEVDRFQDGVYWVPLSSLRDGQLFAATIAASLGLRESAGESIDATVARYLSSKQLLLLLDNLEHLLPAARSWVASAVAAARELQVVATSREPLRIGGEQLYDVPPLAIPAADDDTLAQSDAIALFVSRARAVDPSFAYAEDTAASVTEIVRRLDGLPLAIELAAARVRTLSPAALSRRLDNRLRVLTTGAHDAEERQQTLRSTIEWSYDLLTHEEQELFMRLAVFVGGCRLDAVDAICSHGGELGLEPLDLVGSLVDKSLLRRRDDWDGQPRYWMLETIREFATEHLASSTPMHSATRAAFVEFYEQLARTAHFSWIEKDAAQYHHRFRAELPNIREAVRVALADERPGTALAVIAFFAGQWPAAALFREAAALVEAAIAAGGAESQELEGMAHVCLGALAFEEGNRAYALGQFQSAMSLIADAPTQVWMSHAMFLLVHDSDPLEAERIITRMAGVAEADGHPVLQLATATTRAQAQADAGAFRNAYATASQAAALARIASPENGLTFCLYLLGQYAAALNDLAAARNHFRESLVLSQAAGFATSIAEASAMLALIELRLGDLPAARTSYRVLQDTVIDYALDTAATSGLRALVEAAIAAAEGNQALAASEWVKSEHFRELQGRAWNLVEAGTVDCYLTPLQAEQRR